MEFERCCGSQRRAPKMRLNFAGGGESVLEGVDGMEQRSPDPARCFGLGLVSREGDGWESSVGNEGWGPNGLEEARFNRRPQS